MLIRNKWIYIAFMLVMLKPVFAYGFDDKDTHPRFTEGAINKSVIKEYFKDTLGISEIRTYTLPYKNDNVVMSSASSSQLAEWNKNGWPILELLKAGSASEDTPNCRA